MTAPHNDLMTARAIRDALTWALEAAGGAQAGRVTTGQGGSSTPSIEALVGASAAAHRLPRDLIAAIVQVESSGNTWATRWEGGFYDRYIRDRTWPVYGAVSKSTERVGLATSWGLMQVMGATARERGYDRPFFAELCDPATGIEYGCRHLVYLRGREDGDLERVVRAYNTGRGDPSTNGNAYLAKVKAAGWGG